MNAAAFFAPPAGGRFSNRRILALFLPLFLTSVVSHLSGLLDTVIASDICEEATVGVSYASTVAQLCQYLVEGFVTGGSILTVQYVGKGDDRRAGDASRSTLYLVFALLLLTLTMLFAPERVIRLAIGKAVPAETLAYGGRYLSLHMLSLPISGFASVMAQIQQAQGNTRITMRVSLATTAATLFGKWLFTLLMPGRVEALALSTVLGTLTGAVLWLVIFNRRPQAVRLAGSGERILWERSLLGRVIALGLPVGLGNMAIPLCQILIQRMVAGYGTLESAACAMAGKLQSLCIVIPASWLTVTSIVIGQCLGAGETEHARQYVGHLSKLCFAMQLVNAALVLLLKNSILGWFGARPETLEVTGRLFVIYTLCNLFFYIGAYGVLPTALRAGGDTRYPMILSLIGLLGVRVGVGYLMGTVLGLKSVGVYMGLFADWGVRALLQFIRFKSGKWCQKKLV